MSKFEVGDRVYRTYDSYAEPRTIHAVADLSDGLQHYLIVSDDELTLIKKGTNMHIYKVGDKAKIINNDRGCFSVGEVYQVKAGTIIGTDGFMYPYQIEGVEDSWKDEELELVTMNPYKKGDLVKEKAHHSNAQTVIEVLGDLVFLSGTGKPEVSEEWFHYKELERWAKTVKIDTPDHSVREVTLEEIAEKFNVDPLHIRVKKES